jgi:hypothetical protein
VDGVPAFALSSGRFRDQMIDVPGGLVFDEAWARFRAHSRPARPSASRANHLRMDLGPCVIASRYLGSVMFGMRPSVIAPSPFGMYAIIAVEFMPV